MFVTVEAIDMTSGRGRQDLGTFDSVQLTGGAVRDPDGNILATLTTDADWKLPDGTAGWDIVIS